LYHETMNHKTFRAEVFGISERDMPFIGRKVLTLLNSITI
jgi:hypothetical protein